MINFIHGKWGHYISRGMCINILRYRKLQSVEHVQIKTGILTFKLKSFPCYNTEGYRMHRSKDFSDILFCFLDTLCRRYDPACERRVLKKTEEKRWCFPYELLFNWMIKYKNTCILTDKTAKTARQGIKASVEFRKALYL